jgi:hypothetical protein
MKFATKERLCVVGAVFALTGLVSLETSAGPPPAFSVSPKSDNFSAAANAFEYQMVTVTTSHHPVVINNPATFTGDPVFWDTQAGTCWQHYEVFGNPIPPQTSCTIQVGFHPTAIASYSATLSVERCTTWTTNPAYGNIVCATLGETETVSLTGNGT